MTSLTVGAQLVLWVMASIAMPTQACEKTVRWNDDPPFSQRQPGGEICGITIDQVRATLRRLGCTVRLVEMPWARALAELEAGRLDVLPDALRSPERERFAHFSIPGPQFPNALFLPVAPGKPVPFTSLADLRGTGFRLGAQIGVSYGPSFDQLMLDPVFAAQVKRVSSRQSLWKMADAGRLDGVLADQLTGRLELARLGLQDRIRSVGLIVPHGGAAVAFSRKSVDPEFVARYDKAYAAMLADGSVAAILRRYGADGLASVR